MAVGAVTTKRRSTFDLWRETPTWMVVVVTLVGLAICWSGLGEDVVPRLWSPPDINELRTVSAKFEPHSTATAPYVFEEPSGRTLELFCDPWVVKANNCISQAATLEGTIGDVSFFDARKSNLFGVRHIIMAYHAAGRTILTYPSRLIAIREAAGFQDRSRMSGLQLLALAVYGLPLSFLLYGLAANLRAVRRQRTR